MIEMKEEYTLKEAAWAMGKSTEYVRQRLTRDYSCGHQRIRNQMVSWKELMDMALPNLDTPRLPNSGEEKTYTLDEIVDRLA